MFIGRLPGGDGRVTVSGTGRSLDLRGGEPGRDIGRDGGVGALTLEAGASFSALNLRVGSNRTATPLPSTGTVTVTGVGSQFTLSSDFAVSAPGNPLVAGTLDLGRGLDGKPPQPIAQTLGNRIAPHGRRG